MTEAAQSLVGAECVVARAAPAGEHAPPHASVVGLFGARGETPLASLARLEVFVRDRRAPVRMSRKELSQDQWSVVVGDDNAMPFDAYLAAPLAWSDGQPMGVLQVIGKRGGADFDADDEAVIAQLAHVASIAVQNRVFGDAREASRLKDEFFTNLSHEFRNPLNAVVGWLQVLQKIQADDPRSEAGARALAAVQRNTTLLTRLVDDFLDVSRIVSRRMTIQTKPMALEEMVRQTVDSLRVAAEAKSIHLRCELPDAGLDVLGDAQRLTQALWNLLSNAIKFTPAEGKVTVSLAREAAEAAIVVEDTGEGIAPDFLPHVFERFRQGNTTTMRLAGGGLGLGLSIVRSVVDLHGGTVRAESDGPGRGARFTIRLPLLSAPVELDRISRAPHGARRAGANVAGAIVRRARRTRHRGVGAGAGDEGARRVDAARDRGPRRGARAEHSRRCARRRTRRSSRSWRSSTARRGADAALAGEGRGTRNAGAAERGAGRVRARDPIDGRSARGAPARTAHRELTARVKSDDVTVAPRLRRREVPPSWQNRRWVSGRSWPVDRPFGFGRARATHRGGHRVSKNHAGRRF